MRPFAAALPEAGMLDEARILDTLGVEMDVDLYTQTPAAAAAEIGRLGVWSGAPHPSAVRTATARRRRAGANPMINTGPGIWRSCWRAGG